MTVEAVRERYDRFARDEAHGRSAVYEAWARRVAQGPAAEIIASLPQQRQQPPLVFAVTRQLGSGDVSADEWESFVLAHADELRAEIAVRSLQTNEPLRCAALLPALALIDGPIALIELGASGGLCLYPDQYLYRYELDDNRVMEGWAPEAREGLMLTSALRGDVLPTLRQPEIVWRAGIDLDPLDVTKPDDARWLQQLVWPGEEGRAQRIANAVAVVAADPPVILRGGAAERLDDALALAPKDATIVVTTPGVLPFLPWAERTALAHRLREGDARWITLDSPRLHDAWTDNSVLPDEGFALALDGRVLAAADPLGAWVRWYPTDVGTPA